MSSLAAVIGDLNREKIEAAQNFALRTNTGVLYNKVYTLPARNLSLLDVADLSHSSRNKTP